MGGLANKIKHKLEKIGPKQKENFIFLNFNKLSSICGHKGLLNNRVTSKKFGIWHIYILE